MLGLDLPHYTAEDCFDSYEDGIYLYGLTGCCTDLAVWDEERYGHPISVDVTVCRSLSFLKALPSVYEYRCPFLSLFSLLGVYVLETGSHSAAHA